ncbi:hypothetical protein MLD38_016897 [Melastoma candidum]|uniref:Uncharacterized protein n=1 Tax=Melastoma candidum TaxID=119954 RepID=A0ACB9QSX9_9MYRT|nr:hypothetical protein MLD38_016897 [Melastoma candidum]
MGSLEKCEDKELDRELLPFIRIFKDGTILRPPMAPRVPPSLSDPALQWVAAHSTPSGAIPEEPWLAKHGDFSCGGLFVGGDSAGGNIAHHLLMRAGREPLNGGVKNIGGNPDSIRTEPGRVGCERLLIGVAEEDLLLDRGIQYYNAVKESGWKGEAELVIVPGEDHAFHIVQYQKESAAVMIKRMATFLTGRNKRRPVDDSLVIASPPV